MLCPVRNLRWLCFALGRGAEELGYPPCQAVLRVVPGNRLLLGEQELLAARAGRVAPFAVESRVESSRELSAIFGVKVDLDSSEGHVKGSVTQETRTWP